MAASPSRGDIWLTSLDPTRGHEPARTRPVVVLSTDLYNHGPSGRAVIAPLTSVDRRVRWHILVEPPEGGLRRRSFIQCDDIRSISVDRFVVKWGAVSTLTLGAVEERLRVLLEV